MRFEFDEAKSSTNKVKHGIDFIDAQALWRDPDRLEIAARSAERASPAVIGHIGDTLWSAFSTCRHEQIRIISVRRA